MVTVDFDHRLGGRQFFSLRLSGAVRKTDQADRGQRDLMEGGTRKSKVWKTRNENMSL